MRTYIFGDLHGSGIELTHLLQKISPASDDRLVFVGDVFDRATHGHIVWDIIHKYKVTVLMGNHEYKILSFLQGKRDYLPPHYCWCLNNLINHGVSVDELIRFLQGLPILKVFDKFIVAHAGINIDSPTVEDISWNVYGNLKCDKKVPIPNPKDKKKYWWDDYKTSIPVYYGHFVTYNNVPRIGCDNNGVINSIGLDTAVCHGGPLTAVCPETNEFFQYKSGVDYYGPLKKSLKSQPIVLEPYIINAKQRYLNNNVST